MADPLTVIGGLAAVAQLSGSAARLTRRLYRFARDVKGVTAEVDRFASQVRSFSLIVDLAQVTLSRYCVENPESRVVAYLSSHHVLPNINSDAIYTSEHIWDIRDRLHNAPTRFALVTTIVWWFYKPDVMELYPEMESIKTNLSLLMATTHLEALLQRASGIEQGNTWLQKDIKDLRRMLKTQMKTIRDLDLQLNRERRINGIEQTDFFSHSHQAVLLNLGRSMCKNGVVPDPLPDSPSVSLQSLQSRVSASSPSDGSNKGQAWNSEAYSTISSPSTPSSRHPSTSSGPPIPDEPFGAQPKPSSEAGQSSAPSQPPGVLNTNSIPPPFSIHIPTTSSSAVNGYIIPTGPRHINTIPSHATALLVPDLPINIISRSAAGRYNVDIRWFETSSAININSTSQNAQNTAGSGGGGGGNDGGGILLDFGNGRRPERSIGRATLHWSRSSQRHDAYYMSHTQLPPLVVECEVCENVEVGLVLGKPFVDERDRRRRRSGSH